jgi:Flp pilus assembly protein TadG
MALRADERGVLSPFIAVIALALVMVAGMVYDGGEVLAAQARARDLAGNAARAGAQELDLDELRASGRAVLLPDRAFDAANAFLLDAGTNGDVVVDGARITVTVHFAHAMRILPLPDRTIAATETATAVAGLDESDVGS